MQLLQLGGFDNQIKDLRLPLLLPVREELERFATASGPLAGQAFRRAELEKFAHAKVAEDLAQRRAAEHMEKLRQGKADLAAMSNGSWVVGTGMLISFAACVGAEYVTNAEVLPWLLSVSKTSTLGVALSLAPAAAPLLLDQVLVEVFRIEGLRHQWIDKVSGQLRRVGRWIGRSVPFAAAGGLALYSLWLIAKTRPILMEIKSNIEAVALSAAQQLTIDVALQWLAISLAVTGAFFYLVGIDLIRTAHARRKCRLDLVALEQERKELDERLAAAAQDRMARESDWDQVDKREPEVVAAYFAECKVELAKLAANPGSLRNRVEHALWPNLDRHNPMGTERQADAEIVM